MPKQGYYGDGTTFLFKNKPRRLAVYPATGLVVYLIQNEYYIYSHDFLAFGGGYLGLT
jgi:hypothetical protein